ncbi:MAG: hypothetical protein V3T31_07665, partial [candidate division Zixibacteria bacterium]
GNLLRTWDGDSWDESSWNWNVAYTYAYDTWYYAELEKINDSLILRLYDADQNIIIETDPASLTKVNAMDDSTEFLYVGEPHTDDYEGNVRIDEITLLLPASECCIGLTGDLAGVNNDQPDISDLTALINHLFITFEALDCPAEANTNDDAQCQIDISDLTALVNHLFVTFATLPECNPACK